MKTNIVSLLFVPLLTCFLLSPRAQAVTPAPDGGYPGGNTAEGDNALFNLTTGINNTAVGANALRDTTTGGYNVGIGNGVLANNTSGFQNTAIGTQALTNNTANYNSAIGFRALFMNTTGRFNTALGSGALASNNTAEGNTAVGCQALYSNTDGLYNTANGFGALFSNTTGILNTAVGVDALAGNTRGSGNTAIGREALLDNIQGHSNTAVGDQALRQGEGQDNTAVGRGALFDTHRGEFNTAVGVEALSSTTGSRNTAIGELALFHTFSSGSDNIAVGARAGSAVSTANNSIAIGTAGANVSNSCFIGQIRGVTTQNNDAMPVLIDSAGQLGTASSSRRYKSDIKPMDKASESILGLKPVSFRYKVHKDTTPQFGLIAEEVAEINPNLVIYDADGKPYTVRYDAVNAMLLNEFLKEHRKVAELEATITQQQKEFASKIAQQQNQIEALRAGLQKVSAQLEASKPAPQVVVNN